MVTQTRTVGSKVRVNVMEQSVIFVTNALIQLQFRIVHKRRLPASYLQEHLEVIERGLRTWLAERKLRSLTLQIALPGAAEATENWLSILEYYADPSDAVRQPPIGDVEAACRSLKALPGGAAYQLFAHLDPDASEVEGWAPGTQRPLNVASEQDFDEFGYGHIGAKVRYQSGAV